MRTFLVALQVLMAILLYSVSSAVGQNFVYFTVTEFGPLILTTVTTVRKIFSTLYSVFRTPSNTLSPMQWGGCSMVFAGLLGDIVRKMTAPKAAPKAAPAVEQAAPAETSGDVAPRRRRQRRSPKPPLAPGAVSPPVGRCSPA